MKLPDNCFCIFINKFIAEIELCLNLLKLPVLN